MIKLDCGLNRKLKVFSRMKQKSLQKIESKERILNVASRLFKKNGYAATGIDQIMADAGLTAGAFYAHFKSKTDLLERSIEHSFNYSREMLTKNTEHLLGEEKINAMMERYTSKTHRDLPEKGCLLPALAAELHRGSSRSSQLIEVYLNKWAQMISLYLPSELTTDEKKKKALGLISQAVGAVLLSRMVEDHKFSDEILKAGQK